MTKVLRIINRFNLGGPTYNVAYLSRYMRSDFETLLAGGVKESSEDSSEFILENLGLKPRIIQTMRRSINPLNDYKAYNEIRNIIREFKPDIVHTHASKAGALGRLAAIKESVPIKVHTFHGHVFHSYFNPFKTSIYKGIERYLASHSDAIVAISDKQKEELSLEHKICPADKITVIPLGFDLNRFRENQEEKRKRFRDELKIADDVLVISIIGRLVPIKNHSLFLEAAKELSGKTNRKLRFVIVGDGSERKKIEEMCRALSLPYSTVENGYTDALISFTSWRKDADVVCAGSDIICLTSNNEGTPVSLIEAQAANKPVVSTRVGGIENIVSKETALLSEVGDNETFFSNLESLILSDSKRHEMSLKGWDVVGERFHYTRLVSDMERLYDDLVAQKLKKILF